MKIIPCEQHSLEWLIARAGIPTASEFHEFMTTDFELRKGAMVQTYLAKKLGERWFGGPLAGAMTLDMEFGRILEDEAIPFYEFEFSESIQRVGLIVTDDGRIGCSPDGLIGADGGIEIKCPRVETHIKNLLNGDLPKEYAAQVHGSMFVTGRQWWKFMSYCRRMPPMVLTIMRDEEIQEKIAATLSEFLAQFDAGLNYLRERNGGTLPERAKEPEPEPEFVSETPT